MRINSINTNLIAPKTKKHISFKEGTLNNITPNVALLSLQNPNAGIKFEKDVKLTQNADAVQANPVTALGYKLYKTFKIIFNPEADNSNAGLKKENLSLIV